MKRQRRIGDTIAGRYEVSKIMSGSMGVVYVCYDRKLREVFVAKTFIDDFPDSTQIDSAIKRFIQEGKIWISLGSSHRNIATAKFIEVIDDRPYIFLEYVSGGTLRDLLTEDAPIDLTQMLELSIQICAGMDYVSKAGVVHGDLKPTNILLTQSMDAKITDFGLARALGGSSLSELAEDQTISFAGTPYYAAPEQFTHFRHADTRADIYAYGVMLYEMFTRKLPFKGQRLAEIVEDKIVRQCSPSPMNLNPDVPKKLDNLIQRCLAVDPKKRPQTFADILRELQRIYYGRKQRRYKLRRDKKTETAWDLNNRGYSLYNIGYAQEAMHYFEEALKVMPNVPEVLLNMGAALDKLGRHREAAECFDRAIKIDPDIAKDRGSKGFVKP